MKKIFTFLFLLISTFAFSQSTTVVISQVYGGGGGSGYYKYDYVELHNVSGMSQSLTGMSLQYGSAAGNFGSTSSNIYPIPAGTSIPAGGYLLIQFGSAGTAGASFPVTPDLITGNLSMSGSSGKVALINGTTGNVCGATGNLCNLSSPTYIDVVSYGASNNGEGNTTVNNGAALTSAQGAVRKNNGCTETNNNNADFDVVTNPVPRNSSSPIVSCVPLASLSASALSGFGNVCINNNATNSFTITGTNLTTATVDIASLSGYGFSQSASGPFTSTLSLTPASGSLNATVYVQFSPTATQAYNGDISISGGGVTTPITVAASGTGVNSAPLVATNSATGITQTSATINGTISDLGCSALTSYGFEYSISSGFTNGSGIAVTATNLNSNAFSANLSGLATGTTYYYKAFATNGGGTTYGSQMQFNTLTPDPSLTAGALTGFGNVCTNATSNVNSFNLAGDNLTGADVTIGPLAGYTFATSVNGTYSNTLTFSGYGSRFTSVIYVKFTPTAVQSYNGDIVISGGGTSTATNVAVTGAGVNLAPTVSAGTASAITFSTATVAGTISNTGCTTVTDYGIEYSTTTGFANGAGTKVNASNLSSSNYSVNLTGLTPSTTYYYKLYATNGGGTTYGTQQSFTTAAPPPPVITATTLTAFGSNCINSTTGANSFTVTGANLTNANLTVGPLAGYTFSTTANGTYTSSLSLPQTGGTFTQVVYVKFTPTAAQSYNGNIPVSGGGVTTSVNVAASGTGVNTQATPVTGANSNLTTKTATLAGSISANGCSAPTTYGIEYSGNANFVGGQGTSVSATNLTNGNFSVSVPGLVQGATYYYKAFATNAGGTAYGATMNFTVPSIGAEFYAYPVPAVRGRAFNFSMNNLKAGNYGLVFYDITGHRIYQQFYNVQGGFINESIRLPFSIPSGVYQVQLIKDESVIATRKISIL